MNSFYLTFEKIFSLVFAPRTQKFIEKIILFLAALGFVIHLGLIFLKTQGVIFPAIYPELFNDPNFCSTIRQAQNSSDLYKVTLLF